MSANQPKILVVDDNVALARVTQFAFQNAGCLAETAGNGRIALELAMQTQFDLIVTDEQMPEMTGLELCRCLRGLPEYLDVPIVMLTAKGLELELPRISSELGIEAVFSKPFSPSEVVGTARQLMAAAPLTS